MYSYMHNSLSVNDYSLLSIDIGFTNWIREKLSLQKYKEKSTQPHTHSWKHKKKVCHSNQFTLCSTCKITRNDDSNNNNSTVDTSKSSLLRSLYRSTFSHNTPSKLEYVCVYYVRNRMNRKRTCKSNRHPKHI